MTLAAQTKEITRQKRPLVATLRHLVLIVGYGLNHIKEV